MIEPRCPGCISPEIEPDPQSTIGRWRCEHCGRRFQLEHAFVRLGEAEDFRSAMGPERTFRLRPDRARIEMRACDGALRTISPFSDVEEMHQILDAAAARRVIEARRPGAALRAYLSVGAPPHPVLGVDPGVGAELIGPSLALVQGEGEDPIAYTLRWLGYVVDAANGLLIGRLRAGSGSGPAERLRPEGPRSHRPAAEPRPQRRFVGDALVHRPDGTLSGRVDAEGPTISAVLATLGTRIETSDIDPDADILVEAAVTGPVEDDEERAP
jgi:hypothetical protein